MFPLWGVKRARAPNVNVGLPIISETAGARKLKLKTQRDVNYFGYSFWI